MVTLMGEPRHQHSGRGVVVVPETLRRAGRGAALVVLEGGGGCELDTAGRAWVCPLVYNEPRE